MFCLFTPKGWSKWPVKTLCNYKRMWLGKGRHETWYVDWPCRPWDIADLCTLQACLTEATEGLQSALPPNCPCLEYCFSFEPCCHIQFILLVLWPHSCLYIALSSTQWWMGLYCLKPPWSLVFIISAVWRWACLCPLCWNWVEIFLEEANSRAHTTALTELGLGNLS